MFIQTSLLKYYINTKLTHKKMHNISRVPVVSKEGKPLMPTKASRARKWIKTGKAVKRWSKTGLFYFYTLPVEQSDTKLQEIVLALDPGSKYDGITVATKREVQLQSMLIMPKGIATFEKSQKWIVSSSNCKRICHNPIMAIHPRSKTSWFSCYNFYKKKEWRCMRKGVTPNRFRGV